MQVFTWLSFLLIILLLTSMTAKVKPWRKLEKPGKALKTLPMGLQARMQIHRSALVAIGFALIFGVSAGWMEPGMAFIIAAFCMAVVLLPMQYTFTSQGVALGEAIFRSWDEFSGVQFDAKQIKLQHPRWFGRLTLFIKPEDLESVFKKVKFARNDA